METVRDVIADIIDDWSIRNGFEVGFGKCTNDYADEIISRLEAQGFVVVRGRMRGAEGSKLLP